MLEPYQPHCPSDKEERYYVAEDYCRELQMDFHDNSHACRTCNDEDRDRVLQRLDTLQASTTTVTLGTWKAFNRLKREERRVDEAEKRVLCIEELVERKMCEDEAVNTLNNGNSAVQNALEIHDEAEILLEKTNKNCLAAETGFYSANGHLHATSNVYKTTLQSTQEIHDEAEILLEEANKSCLAAETGFCSANGNLHATLNVYKSTLQSTLKTQDDARTVLEDATRVTEAAEKNFYKASKRVISAQEYFEGTLKSLDAAIRMREQHAESD